MKDYFDMSKKEQKGALALIGLIMVLFGLQFLWGHIGPAPYANFTNAGPAIKPIKSTNDSFVAQDTVAKVTSRLFDFDPNTATGHEFLQLGLPQVVVNHILHYREKGGHFYKKADLGKIYGLTEEDFDRLEPYVIIKPGAEKPVDVMVDLNTSDSLGLLAVKGIGPVFASRILAMRKKLGAFVNKGQLMDVYGIGDAQYGYIKSQVYVSQKKPKTIDINKASVDELKTNPYIRYKLANIIVAYRNVHGPFQSTEELKNIVAIDAATWLKLRPYVRTR
jgi:competence protein ComEA